MSARPTMLLAEYLRKHPLEEADLEDFAHYQAVQQNLRASLFQSLLLRWQHDAPASLRAHRLGIQAWENGSLAELAARRLTPLRQTMFAVAPKDPELLHFYARFLMQAYREQRSVFYLPNTAELQTDLQRLLEVNPGYQRVYKLHLAELAWDRGDDAKCLRLGREALDPTAAGSGPMKFRSEPPAPRLVLARMLDSLSRAGKYQEASELIQQTRKNGLLNDAVAEADPLLGLALRKGAAARESG